MLIRVEIGIDAPGIDALLRRAFASDAGAQLVHDLREDGLITLGLVASYLGLWLAGVLVLVLAFLVIVISLSYSFRTP